MIIHFHRQLVESNPDLYFGYIQDSFIAKAVRYMIDRKYRKTVNLSNWLEHIVSNPSQKVIDFASEIPNKPENPDAQMIEILRHVRSRITYTSDNSNFKPVEIRSIEYWQTPDETVLYKRGDCEDGSILIYVCARLKGIRADQLDILCGHVHNPFTKQLEGHAWCAYRPIEYPLNYTFLDWCYYYSGANVMARQKFYIKDKAIHPNDLYKTIWFGINEKRSVLSFKPRIPL